MSISKTFCPAKWDEILVNLSANYVYSCCKSVPVQITSKEDINHALDQQRANLLNGVQDPACDYCWRVENSGHQSLRYQYLNSFDYASYESYKNNQVNLKQIEVSLGNECNFQCVYCNPKFSSQWETDVKKQTYKIFSDRYFYAAEQKNSNNIDDTTKWLKEIKSIDNLEIIGGEPLVNKNFFKLITSIKTKQLGFTTNLSCKTFAPIDRIIKLSTKYDKILFRISIDSTGKNAEFSRYGMDFKVLLRNIHHLLANITPNITVIFNSVMTSLTLRDFTNTIKLMDSFYNINPDIIWNITFCRDPKIFSLNTLPDKFKPELLESIKMIKNKKYIQGLETLEGAILVSKFNKTLYGEHKHFLEEFSARKQIDIPVELE